MSFRVTPRFKARLDQAAGESGRSLMQEIELRLEQSLEREHHLLSALELGFGRRAAGLMLAIGCLIKEAERPRRSTLSDPEVFREIVDSITLLLQAIDPDEVHPAAWATLKKAVRDARETTYAELHASMVVVAIAYATDSDVEFVPLTPLIRNWLGEAVVARLRDRLAQEE
jgi:predicted transcriptional regulator